MTNIIINYPANAQVQGARTVHAMVNGRTGCRRRPVNYSLVKDPVNCQECLKVMPAQAAPEIPAMPLISKVLEAAGVPKQPKRRVIKEVDPEYEQQIAETRGRSRCWMLTQKGLDYLAWLEAKEQQASSK